MALGDMKGAWILQAFETRDGAGADTFEIVTALTSPTIPDLSMVHIELTGSYSFQDETAGGPRNGRFHIQATCRRYDADAHFAGLALLGQQDFYDGFAGYKPQINVSGNTVVVEINDASDGAPLYYMLEVKGFIREATINQPVGGG